MEVWKLGGLEVWKAFGRRAAARRTAQDTQGNTDYTDSEGLGGCWRSLPTQGEGFWLEWRAAFAARGSVRASPHISLCRVPGCLARRHEATKAKPSFCSSKRALRMLPLSVRDIARSKGIKRKECIARKTGRMRRGVHAQQGHPFAFVPSWLRARHFCAGYATIAFCQASP